MLKKRTFYKILYIFLHKFYKLRLCKIRFRENNHAVPDSQNRKNIQMLHCLWHNPFVSRNYKHGYIHTACACEHIFHKFFMAGNIYNSHSFSIWKIQPCKTQLYRNASSLFFLQTIRVDSCQCPDQTRFPMIYMTGCPNDPIPHIFILPE